MTFTYDLLENVEKIRERALKWALANAVEHKGRASVKAVLGKLIAEKPELRQKVKELSAMVIEIVQEVNRLPPEKQRSKLEELGPPAKLPRPKRLELPELPDVEKYPSVTTRFAPNPNGPLHIGHVRAALLSYEYARRYGGRFILRFEDTNPVNALKEMYDRIREDLHWLGIDWDEEYVQSDRLEIYYGYAERLLREGKAYVCTCEIMDFRRLRDLCKPCQCRGLPPAEQLERWQSMLAGEFGKKRAVVRVKTDLKHPNPAVREWPALRVVTAPHPLVGEKYKVWPLYNFSVAIDDHEMGVTHVIRGKEHVVNEQRQRTLFEHMNWQYPTAVQYGRLTMPGVVLSKTQTMRGIKSGEFSGCEDVRLGTIAALRRRGFMPEAIKQLILDIGPTPVDASLSWETLEAYNRSFVDAKANRYFFVPKPVRMCVRGVPPLSEVRLRLHPSYRERGERIVPLEREQDKLLIYLAGEDVAALEKGGVFRLKDLMNVEVRSLIPLEGFFRSFEVADLPKLQWVSAGAVEVEVVKPDGSKETGLAEPAVKKLRVGEVVQFERYGFVRIEAMKPRLVAVYGHR